MVVAVAHRFLTCREQTTFTLREYVLAPSHTEIHQAGWCGTAVCVPTNFLFSVENGPTMARVNQTRNWNLATRTPTKKMKKKDTDTGTGPLGQLRTI